jgi:hypothetical protein
VNCANQRPPASLLDAASTLRNSTKPAAIVTGTLVEISLEQRLFAEVKAQRLPIDVLASLDN